MNFTVTVPPNAQNHGDPRLICLPPAWTDYFIFFATNYFAHAATLISHPGESFRETLISTANALFIPGSGALRALRFLVLYINPLLSGPRRSDALEQASRAGALCMVVSEKSISKPTIGTQDVLQFFFGEDIRMVPSARAIHGVCNIPRPGRGVPRYLLVEVPPNLPLRPYEPRRRPASPMGSASSDTEMNIVLMEPAPINMCLAKNYNIPKILISILQVLWGITTLYKTRGNQIALYGYGAFSLTVAPYAIMSVVNLATNLLRPEYATMYLVHSPDMEEARNHDGEFGGIVASMDVDAIGSGDFVATVGLRRTFIILNALGYLFICILPIALVGNFTHFQSGSNIQIAISWILGWLIIGSVSSLWVRISAAFWLHPIWEILMVIPLWIPAFGGLVVVGQMLKDFGICTEF